MNIRYVSYATVAASSLSLAALYCLENTKKNRFEKIQKVAIEALTSLKEAEIADEEARDNQKIAFDSYIKTFSTHPPLWDFIRWEGKIHRQEAWNFYEKTQKYVEEQTTPALRKATKAFRENLLMPEEKFLETLRAMNSLKSPSKDVPVAVILRATDDHNGACSHVNVFGGILTIARTHHVIFETINSKFQIREVMQKTKNSTGKPIDLLVILAHGSDDSMQFGKEGREAIYDITDVNKEDFSLMNPCGRIILDSCLVGKALAPQIATITGIEVIAPIVSISKDVIRFHQSQDLKVIAICSQLSKDSVKKEQIFRIFRPGQKPTDP